MTSPTRLEPTTPAALTECIMQAHAASRSLEICGGGSKRSLRLPISADAQLDLRGLRGITNYDPEELVVTAHAGTPLAELEAALAERQQMLAFEPFDHGPLLGAAAGCATLGGIIAANVSGSRRLSLGAARDHILGFAAVSGRGEPLKGGGTVVKNVTGFDLPKLMAGSFGTLAVLASVTMRVLPRPRTEASLIFHGLTDEAANRVMSAALGLPAAVAAAAHVPAPQPRTALRLEGFGPSVDARCQDLARALAHAGTAQVLGPEASAAFWQGVRTHEALPTANHVLWRISVPPASGWQVAPLLAADGVHYLYDWGGALVWAAVPQLWPDATGARIPEVARTLGGHASLVRASPAQRTAHALRMGGAPDTEHARLHARLKAAFDPRGILNPGLDLADGL
jgi:glycolate oxidase FAD binding subunit